MYELVIKAELKCGQGLGREDVKKIVPERL